MRQRVAIAIAILFVASLVTAARAAYYARPPLAHTGGFGEPTCRACHFDGPEQPAGTVALRRFVPHYRPGEVYRLVVAIRDSTASAGGFQLAVRMAAGDRAGRQAGMLCALDARVVVVADSMSGVQYASHAGAARADSLEWQLEWRAPSEDVGPVAFHVAANSANDDNSMLGDAILLGNWESQPEPNEEQGPRKRAESSCAGK